MQMLQHLCAVARIRPQAECKGVESYSGLWGLRVGEQALVGAEDLGVSLTNASLFEGL